jgi:transcription elongation GreA/GreB family factor
VRITTGAVVTWTELPGKRTLTRRIVPAADFTREMYGACMPETAPMSIGMMGREEGDQVLIETSAGTKQVRIVEVGR